MPLADDGGEASRADTAVDDSMGEYFSSNVDSRPPEVAISDKGEGEANAPSSS